MNISAYEKHKFTDPDLPIFFHLDSVSDKSNFWIHWHENPELLFFVDGNGFVKIDDTLISAEKGCLITVNSNRIHTVFTHEPKVEYYCLIIDKGFCEQFGFNIEDVCIHEKVLDPELFSSLERIITEINEKKPFFKAAVMGEVINLLLYLFRNYIDDDAAKNVSGKHIEMIKKSITYMKKHCREKISVSDIADGIGYSKYYFCRVFKQATGFTVNEYLNSLKVEQAYAYLKKEGLSISEASAKCGFSDTSYFTKIFKKYMHTLPSQVQSADPNRTDIR